MNTRGEGGTCVEGEGEMDETEGEVEKVEEEDDESEKQKCVSGIAIGMQSSYFLIVIRKL